MDTILKLKFMKVLLVTGFTPYKENYKGISALEYYLIKYRPTWVNIKIISYNLNLMKPSDIDIVKKELNCEIICIDSNGFLRKLLNNKLVRLLLKRNPNHYQRPGKTFEKIYKDFKPDVLWTYPNFYYCWARLYTDTKMITTSPDSNVLAEVRNDIDNVLESSFIRKVYRLITFSQTVNSEKKYLSPNNFIHFVGMNDLRMFRKVTNSTQAFFLLHPHYSLAEKKIRFDGIKIKVLIAGAYDIYMKSGIKDLVNVFLTHKELTNLIDISFLGKNWNDIVKILSFNNYECHNLGRVDNYLDEIIKYDVQLTPITVGTGTKGKVLDAIANGLLCVGTPMALENICVRNFDSCILYHNAEELYGIFTSMFYNRKKYELIAQKGRENVRKYHSPQRISKRFFEIIKSI